MNIRPVCCEPSNDAATQVEAAEVGSDPHPRECGAPAVCDTAIASRRVFFSRRRNCRPAADVPEAWRRGFCGECAACTSSAACSCLTRIAAFPAPSQFCTEYYIDGQRFRAVADTGSPFLLCDGSATASRERWGRFVAGSDDALTLDASEEGYGGQTVGVEWRRGQLRLAGYQSPWAFLNGKALLDRMNGVRSGSWTSPSRSDARFEPINYGVVRSYQGLGGAGAVYLGLVKNRMPRVRPTFLEQTDIQSLRFDFVGRTMTLARKPLLKPTDDAVPLVDLRPLGAPVANYAVRVHRLIANGAVVPLDRECVAIVDTGTTGMVVSDTLLDTDAMPLPGAAVRNVQVEVLTERGRVVTLSAARPRRSLEDIEREQEPYSPPRVENFPLIVVPVSLRWFDNQERLIAAKEARGESVSDSERIPHVLFLGLAFLSKLQLTIDADDMRMSVVDV